MLNELIKIKRELQKDISYIFVIYLYIISIYNIYIFIDSTRFMARLLSNLVNNLSEGIHRIKCKFRHDNKKYET